ncbi:enoyl-CoA hydratase-related protein [Micromonospora sp. NBC_01813]|jgi:methylglutaconyl-CoA hydratase|uniref:enoyl-CoA hydratase-related protein n=1 Tax=Micromonospora sp. NBC_01813 TaxID=2975988 RepID=UPI002DDBCE7A|nr:enoyl-CoA hydratase-related protein [Micromonospora sp. NBC_01813]WSA09311.1 enoyl-CoA hydratase-related protein [Micromonospora sp. NBC_01813]
MDEPQATRSTPADDHLLGAAPLIRTATAGGIATLTLDSPGNRNALSTPLMTQLLDGLAAAVADPAVRVVVLTHTGPVFCSGADLAETAAAYASRQVPVRMLGDVLAAVWDCPKPVVARIGGPARAGGLGLIAAADIAICDAAATFAFTEVRLGVVPAVISATVLRRLQPRAAARLYLTGELFDGALAERFGLVTAAVAADELDPTVAETCAALVRGAPGALAGAKQLIRRVPADDFQTDVGELRELSTGYFLSAEGREGVRAFREKRDPAWVPMP